MLGGVGQTSLPKSDSNMPYKDPHSEVARSNRRKINYNYYRRNKDKVIDIQVPERKICSKCKVEKENIEFHPRRSRKSGLLSWCRDCLSKHQKRFAEKTRFKRIERTYKIDIKDYERMLKEQKGVCKICGEENKRNRTLCVDHNHTTGEIRGLLCDGCNTGIGNLKDSIQLLYSAIKYLS